MSNSRWSAPELIDPTLFGMQRASSSTCTDVWSFGMLCLELMTHVQPYNDIAQDITVAINISKGKLPSRPGQTAISRGLSDELWALMLKCWSKYPQHRPSMTSVKTDIKKLRGDAAGPFPIPCMALHRQCLLVSDTNYLTAPAILTSPLTQVHTEFMSESPLKPNPPTGSRPSTAGSSSSESKSGRSSFGLLNTFRRHSRSSWQQQQHSELLQTIPRSSSSISPISPILPEIKTFAEEGDEGAFGAFDSVQAPRLSKILPRAPSHTFSRHRGGSVKEQPASSQSSLQIPVSSSSLPRDYGSYMPRTPPSDDKPPSVFSDSTSVTSGSESAVSDEQAFVLQAKDGSIEAATLEGLIEQLITDFSCPWIPFNFTMSQSLKRPSLSDVRKAKEYRDVFFTTYIAFTTADDVFQSLVRRFHDAEANTGQHHTLLRIK